MQVVRARGRIQPTNIWTIWDFTKYRLPVKPAMTAVMPDPDRASRGGSPLLADSQNQAGVAHRQRQHLLRQQRPDGHTVHFPDAPHDP